MWASEKRSMTAFHVPHKNDIINIAVNPLAVLLR